MEGAYAGVVLIITTHVLYQGYVEYASSVPSLTPVLVSRMTDKEQGCIWGRPDRGRRGDVIEVDTGGVELSDVPR